MLHTKVSIIGCGCVGISTALGLMQQGVDVVLIDNLPDEFKTFTDRLFALSLSSENYFKNNEISVDLSAMGQEILGIKVFEGKMSSSLDFNPSDIGLENFGYMVSETLFLNQLKQKVSEKKIPVLKGDIDELESRKNFAHIKLSDGSIISSELVILADGKNSKSRDILGVEAYRKQYGEVAITFDIEHEFHHNGVAVEKFMPSGPFAVLPRVGGKKSSIVWAESRDLAENFYNLEEELTSQLMKDRMDGMLGECSIVSKPVIFPLQLVYSKEFYSGRFLLAGDALHSIHPLAGQGLNLGLRDAAAIVELVAQNYNLGMDLGSKDLCRSYKKRRYADINMLIMATDILNQLFINKLPFLDRFRKLGLGIVDKTPLLKNFFTRHAVGLH